MGQIGEIEKAKSNQTERILGVLALAIVLSFAILFVFIAASQADKTWRMATTTLLSAVASLGFGALVGLLFGLPTVRPAKTGDAPAGWFAESTSLEQVADWLTKIIIGVSLVQFKEILNLVASLGTAIGADISCPAGVTCGTTAPGASIIAAFFILGLLTSYFWVRRYLMLEFATARRSAMALEAPTVSEAVAKGAIQVKPDEASKALVLGSSSARIETVIAGLEETLPKFEAGPDPDDPWKGAPQSNPNSGAAITAVVKALKEYPGLYEVYVETQFDTASLGPALAGLTVTFVLHPTFAEPIQTAPIRKGKASLTLVAWGAFTMLVVFPDRSTKEFDLAAVPDAPKAFRDA